MHSGNAIQARRIGATESTQLITAVTASHFREQSVGGVSLTSAELGVWPSTTRHEVRTSLNNYPAGSAFAMKPVWDLRPGTGTGSALRRQPLGYSAAGRFLWGLASSREGVTTAYGAS